MSTRVLSCPGKRVEAKCGEIHHQVAIESMQLLTNQQPEFGEGGGKWRPIVSCCRFQSFVRLMETSVGGRPISFCHQKSIKSNGASVVHPEAV